MKLVLKKGYNIKKGVSVSGRPQESYEFWQVGYRSSVRKSILRLENVSLLARPISSVQLQGLLHCEM